MGLRGRIMSQRVRLMLRGLETRIAPALFTVANLQDSGAGSLRQAVLDANALAGADTINFEVTGTITLTTGELLSTDALTINGPGASLLAISGNNSSRVLHAGISSSPSITVSDVSIVG